MPIKENPTPKYVTWSCGCEPVGKDWQQDYLEHRVNAFTVASQTYAKFSLKNSFMYKNEVLNIHVHSCKGLL